MGDREVFSYNISEIKLWLDCTEFPKITSVNSNFGYKFMSFCKSGFSLDRKMFWYSMNINYYCVQVVTIWHVPTSALQQNLAVHLSSALPLPLDTFLGK